MKKVAVFATGGTIAMKFDAEKGGLIPVLSGKDLTDAIAELPSIADIDVVEFSKIPSSSLSPQMMLKLAQAIDERLKDEDIAGAIVTHGTDTLEETAYIADLYIDSPKPVCFTAAMRSSSDLSPDGPQNILASVRTACSYDARNKGVLVVLNDEIHAAADVTKTHSANLKTFISPFWGPLGYVDADKVLFKREQKSRLNIRAQSAEADVFILKIFTGMDNKIFDFLEERQIRGLVIEGFGRGNIAEAHVEPLKRLLNKGVHIVLTTRTFGRVLDVYAYAGGAKQLKSIGVILGGEITAAKARLKLIMALGVTNDRDEIRRLFDS